MKLIKVNRDRCVQCGLCAAVCPRGLIRMVKAWPEETEAQLCIACGHCVAVCPHEALDNTKAPLCEQIELPPVSERMEEEAVFRFLRSRRSIRCFRDTPVPRDLIKKMLEIGRFAPTGGNSQGISYQVIDQRRRLRELSECTIVWMEEQARLNPTGSPVYAQYVNMYRQTGRDSILRDGTALIVGTAPHSLVRRRENTLLSLEYVELYAPVLGLGTCWVGLLEIPAFAGYTPLLELLQIPEGLEFTGALIVGYPQVVFRRLPDRSPLAVTFQDVFGEDR